MADSKHTPGPWFTTDKRTMTGRQMITTNREWPLEGMVAVLLDAGDEETAANATVLAAAPDLLAVLKEAQNLRHDDYRNDRAWCLDLLDKIEAAIAKAEGR